MELRPGYKQTEVGVIPEDWDVKPIKAVCKLINGRGFKPFEWYESGLPIIRIQNLNGSDDFNFYQGAYDKKLEVEAGQLLFAWSGSRGTSFGPHIWSGPLGLLNYHTWKIQINESQIDKGFFHHALRQLTSFIEGKAHGAAALVHTQKWEMEGFEFPLPPTKAEQEAIAEALSDTDSLIESLEQLITKKRHIKQGAMQELLTGKKRLPGFSGEWREATLGEICTFENGDRGKNYPSAAAFVGDGFPFVNAGHLNAGHINFGEMDYITKNSFDLLGGGKFIPGDILFCLRGSLGKFGIVDHNTPSGAIASSLVIVRNKSAYISLNYLACYFASANCEQMIERWSGGAAQPNLGVQDFARFSISLPSLPEQEAIATILSDMDAEITVLETKLTKTRQLKQGMMHNLLTGKIRLVRVASKIIPFSGKKESVNASTKSHNWQINEAVIIAVLAKHFGSEEYPLARKRCTKLTYLLHRHVERKAEGYLKKAAGPYNPATKYKGPEAIAQKNGYIRPHHNGTYPGFVAATNISQAESYFQQWYGADALAWLEQFRRKKTDELELLATVDMAVEDLRCEGKAVKLGAVKQVIHDHPEWEAKLQREIFSDINIVRAIQICRELFA